MKNKEHSGWVNLKQRFLCLYNEENCMMGGTILVWAFSNDVHGWADILSIWDDSEEVAGIKLTLFEINVYVAQLIPVENLFKSRSDHTS